MCMWVRTCMFGATKWGAAVWEFTVLEPCWLKAAHALVVAMVDSPSCFTVSAIQCNFIAIPTISMQFLPFSFHFSAIPTIFKKAILETVVAPPRRGRPF